jgi:WD40 repeat protein
VPLTGITFAVHGAYVVCATARFMKVLETARLHAPGATVRKVENYMSNHHTVACSPDGRTLAAASDRWAIIVNDIEAPQPHSGYALRHPEAMHDREVTRVDFSGNGTLLASSSPDRKVKIWEVGSGRMLVSMPVAGTGNVFVAFNPASHALAVTGDEETILYELGGLQEQTLLTPIQNLGQAVTFTADGKTLAGLISDESYLYSSTYSRRDDIATWDVGTGRLHSRQPVKESANVHARTPRFLTYHPQQEALVFGLQHATGFHVWEEAPRPRRVHVPTPVGTAISFARDGETLWAALAYPRSNEVVSWKWPDLTPRTTWTNVDTHPTRGSSGIGCMAAGRQWVLAGSRDPATKLLRIRDGQPEHSWPSPGGPVLSVALSPDDGLAVSGTQDGFVQVVRVPGGTPVAEVRAHRDMVETVAFSPDGQLLATGSRDRKVKLWKYDGESLSELMALPSPGPVVSISFSPDGSRLAMLVQGERTVRIWHMDRLRDRLARMGLGW